jgi:uncharacterized iron-regulated protein
VLLTLGLSSGCVTMHFPVPARCRMWVDVYSGEPVSFAEMMDDVAKARVIYVGERHTVDWHHLEQYAIVGHLARRDVPLVLALEQMEYAYQPELDAYNRGEITFDELAERTDWEKRWSNYADYRDAIEAAHQAGAPILALNAKRETVRQVARQGFDGLDAETRAKLPDEILLDQPMYEQHLADVMMVHAHASKEMSRRMFEAQVARDETMADRLSRFLKSPEGAGRTAIVLCGAGHCAQGMGIPTRVRLRMPGVRDRILVMSESGDVVLSPQMQAMARDIEITHEQLRALNVPIADYLLVKSPKPEPE